MQAKIICVLIITLTEINCELQSLPEVKVLRSLLPPVPTFKEIAETCGKTCEEYNVTTEDGYILKLFRIPGNSSRPVLLMHGILHTSDAFIVRKNISFAITLANKGYDVWAGNNRGNRYSRSHVSLDPDTDEKFWDFSFHELAYYDLPIIIDFVLNKTGQTKLSAVGHSEGTTIFYVLGAMKTEYNKKIKVLASLAPIAYLDHTKGGLGIGIEAAPILNGLVELKGYDEVLGFNSDLKIILRYICSTSVIAYDICVTSGLFLTNGADPEQFEPDFLTTYISHFPAGTSWKNFVHYAQVGKRNIFARYDYGPVENVVIYGSVTPPEYNLSTVTMNVAFYKGRNDLISTLMDVARLKTELPNVVEDTTLDYDLWNHIDHVIGLYMPKYLFPYLIKLLEKYD